MYFIDSHCHIDSEKFQGKQSEILKACLESSVNKLVVPNVDEHGYEAMYKLCEQHPEELFPCVGIHPVDVRDNYQEQLNFVAGQLPNSKLVAVGEIGLDYYWSQEKVKEQQIAFRTQIELAIEHHLPINVHCREAYSDTLAILEEYVPKGLKGVLHCFGSDYNDAKRLVDLGFYLGIGGVVTFKNTNLREVVKQIGLEHLLLETDAPYLAPTTHRGKLNTPEYIPLVAQTLADVFECDVKKVAEMTTHNSELLYNI